MGPDHQDLARQWLAEAEHETASIGEQIAVAQVHATLAVVQMLDYLVSVVLDQGQQTTKAIDGATEQLFQTRIGEKRP